MGQPRGAVKIRNGKSRNRKKASARQRRSFPTTTFMMLPDDLVLNCLARVSRLCNRNLSLACKRFRSLLVSTELYQTRALLGCTETCLYVCFNLPNYYRYSRQKLVTLCRRPNSYRSRKFLLPITCPYRPRTYGSDFARVGSKIYSIGGRRITGGEASSSVMVMDCRSHTWSDAPSMLVARATPSACVLDGKIYVTGGCENLHATNWMEKVCSGFRHQRIQALGYDGNVYVKFSEEREVSFYKMEKRRWRAADLGMAKGLRPSSSLCVIENVLYSCTRGRISWYDSQAKLWKPLEGDLRKLYDFGRDVTQVADYGGKLAVLWADYTTVWYLVIALEKRQGGMIWGTIEWVDAVCAFLDSKVAHLVADTL
ncbi:unnamed protein product [Microthlaspi erraticum]|uniref:F-box domain-containing protein n=1 Tax=Microthlaspi erraticum TaxID=1685480 RepID=A0A6D2J8H2_9BRAS|nr:unnamed protein product [Microthlaspi erraticum]